MTQTDREVLNQAITHFKESEVRKNRTFYPNHGVGHVVTGSIFDCDRETFERAIKAYSSDLYVGWNPFKNNGVGCWEVWQRPRKKTLVTAYESSDLIIHTLEYKPNSFENHVYDLAFLNYDFIKRLREMDMWENKGLIKNADDAFDDHLHNLDKKEEESIRYAIRHNKQAFKKLRDLAKDGYNPLWFFSDKRQGDGEV